MNVWERAKEELRLVALDGGGFNAQRRAADLLSEMERVECLEGGSYYDGVCGWDFDAHQTHGAMERPALLLLLSEEDR